MFSFNKKQKKKQAGERGQGFVEFSLALPILLILVLGVVEVGRLLFTFVAVTTSSREGARYGSAVGVGANGAPYYSDCLGIRESATTLGRFEGMRTSIRRLESASTKG